ncbi:MAG: hypothetical protein GXO71_08115 [Caldiserica bacterium]|nr:hypothetical protein [Caldisericota bacterium]
MNAKKRALSVFEGIKLDRFPMWYGADEKTSANIMKLLGIKEEEHLLRALGIDFRTIRPRYIGPPLTQYEDGSVDTVWGIRRGGAYYGQALNHPLSGAESVKDIEEFSWPNPAEWEVEQEAEKYQDFCLIGGAWSPFFHDVSELFGMEEMFVKMVLHPDVVEAACEKCVEFYQDQSRRMFELAGDLLDMFFIGNDFGSQNGLLCSPEMWRRFFAPGIKAMIDLGHQYKLKVALHSCGDIHEILPDLIDMGLDAINPIQVSAAHMDPVKLKKEIGKDIVFFGGIDIEILRRGTEEDVRRETRRIIEILGEDNRYIVAPSHDYLLPEIPAKNIVAMYEEARKV